MNSGQKHQESLIRINEKNEEHDETSALLSGGQASSLGYQERARRLREQLANLQPIPTFEEGISPDENTGEEYRTVLPPTYGSLTQATTSESIMGKENTCP